MTSTHQQQQQQHSYETALEALFSFVHQAQTKTAIEKAALRRTETVADMQRYVERCGLACTPKNQNSPIVIHIAGTKGKGSTACLCESLLRKVYHMRTGLFTSPHLVDIRERIRINGTLVSKNVFGVAYWAVRQKLEAYNTSHEGEEGDAIPVLPGYFRMLVLVALYIFTHYRDDKLQPLDVWIMEVGMGGRYDATNVIHSTVQGLTLMDYDHTRILGRTLPEIAWEKGGILDRSQQNKNHWTPHPKRQANDYKEVLERYSQQQQQQQQQQSTNSPNTQTDHLCFALDTNTQPVLDVLRLCAHNEGRGQVLQLVGADHPQIPPHYHIGLPGTHQRDNAELALQLCLAAMKQKHESPPMDELLLEAALATTTWPGRCQTVVLPSTQSPVRLHLDGAHTVESLRACLQWYSGILQERQQKNNDSRTVLMFNCSHEKSPLELLQLLRKQNFDAVHFCPSDSERPSPVAKPTADEILLVSSTTNSSPTPRSTTTTTWQDTLLEVWNRLERSPSINIELEQTSNLTVKQVIQRATNMAAENQESSLSVDILVTGSLYLVGSALSAIDWQEQEATGQLLV